MASDIPAGDGKTANLFLQWDKPIWDPIQTETCMEPYVEVGYNNTLSPMYCNLYDDSNNGLDRLENDGKWTLLCCGSHSIPVQ